MSYNKFRVVGKRLNFLSFKRLLHDSKLPFVTADYINPDGVDWIGTESPRKADINSYEVTKKSWTSRQIDNKSEYDDEYFKNPEPYSRED